MKKIIVYATKTGTSEKYAKALSELIQVEYCNIKSLKKKKVDSIDKIIYVAPIRMNKLYMFDRFVAKFNCNGKVIIPICVGLSPHNEEYINFIKEKNFKNLQNVDNIFYLRGAMDKNRLPLFDKCVVNMILNNLGRKEILTQKERMIYDMLNHNSDYVDFGILDSIVKSII